MVPLSSRRAHGPCHPEEPMAPCHPEEPMTTLSSRRAHGHPVIPKSPWPPHCHSEEQRDEESLRICRHFPPYPRLRIPRFVRNDTSPYAGFSRLLIVSVMP